MADDINTQPRLIEIAIEPKSACYRDASLNAHTGSLATRSRSYASPTAFVDPPSKRFSGSDLVALDLARLPKIFCGWSSRRPTDRVKG
jgi:hypothetical protein